MTFYTYSWTCTLKTMVYFSMIMCHVIGLKLHRIGLKSFLEIFNEWFDHHICLIAFIRHGWFACNILHLEMSINYRWLLKWYGLLLIKVFWNLCHVVLLHFTVLEGSYMILGTDSVTFGMSVYLILSFTLSQLLLKLVLFNFPYSFTIGKKWINLFFLIKC